MQPPPLVAGRYRVEERIGSTRWGEVFLGVDLGDGGGKSDGRGGGGGDGVERGGGGDGGVGGGEDGECVAVKILHPEMAMDPVAVERFRREAAILKKLTNPAFPRLLAFGRDGDGPIYMVCELLEAPTLRDLLASGPIEPGLALAIARRVLDGLYVAHEAGVVHRDLAPEIIQVVRLGDEVRVKILDFGVARVATADASLGRRGAIYGSPPYVAPEQVKGLVADARADLYALGCIAYEMLAGAPPFQRESDAKTMMAHVHDVPRPLAERTRGLSLPPGTCDWVMKALHKDPDRRHRSARTMAETLDVILAWRWSAASLDPETSPHANPLDLSSGGDSLRFGRVYTPMSAPSPVAPPRGAALVAAPGAPWKWIAAAGAIALAVLAAWLAR